jgi:signal peptidase I
MANPLAWHRERKARLHRRRQSRCLGRAASLVLRFRWDLLDVVDREELQTASRELREARGNASERHLERVRQLLLRTGGNIYPAQPRVENTEVLLTAAILALALRVFFLQTFSIPTNSMWPSYKGMGTEFPAVMDRTPLGNFFCGAKTYDIISPADGMVYIPLNSTEQVKKQKSHLPYVDFHRWRFAIWPVRLRRYYIFVNDEAVPVEVPPDFNLERLLMRRFFPYVDSYRLADVLVMQHSEMRNGRRFLCTGKRVELSEDLLSFELIHGDVLFVERLTPHFRRPHRGDAVVFATRAVAALSDGDRYYIKRLVALGGDRVAVHGKELHVNEELADFSPAMKRNNRQYPPFEGYFPLGSLATKSVKVSKGEGFVMGDNSADSYDSRYFGAIPLRAIIGKPLLHVYPFLPAKIDPNGDKSSRSLVYRILHFWERSVDEE